ncbi:hypothetical protein LT85_2467 [Collimonas arenae]|uniref:Uncharacterized protein n=2 Tax=Collimonas arenae TaxID=279058 RepID=A0A0A1FCW5_9BURK|nr:hypothetical protein LT85_2467 [Collimonas arenae]
MRAQSLFACFKLENKETKKQKNKKTKKQKNKKTKKQKNKETKKQMQLVAFLPQTIFPG